MSKNSFKKGFTLAEVLIVLTILGIIATIYMTTLKPADFKVKGLAVAAKKALYDIDTATTEILINDTTKNSAGSQLTSAQCATASLATLYKKYLTATRAKCTSTIAGGGANFIMLKSGVCIGFATAAKANTIFPGESTTQQVTPTCALIYIDINGEDGPDTTGVDRFVLPLNYDGIKYES